MYYKILLLLILLPFSSSRSLLANTVLQGGSCPELTIDTNSVTTSIQYCNAKGAPLCCEKIKLVVQRALSGYAADTGVLFEADAQKGNVCLNAFVSAYDSGKVRPNATIVLQTCNITAGTFSSSPLKACGRQLGNWTSIADLAGLPLKSSQSLLQVAQLCTRNLQRPNASDSEPRSCVRDLCESAIVVLGQALSDTASRQTPPPVCQDLVRTVIPNLGQVPGGSWRPAGLAITRCLWDPSFLAKCTRSDFGIFDYTSAYQACITDPPADPTVNQAIVNVCFSVLIGISRAANIPPIVKDRNFVPPPIQSEACARALKYAFEYHGITAETSEPLRKGLATYPLIYSTRAKTTAAWVCTNISTIDDYNFLHPDGVEHYRNACGLTPAGTCQADYQPCLHADTSADNLISKEDDVSDPYYRSGLGCSLMGLSTYLANDYGTNFTKLFKAVSCTLNITGKYEIKPNFTYLSRPDKSEMIDFEALVEAREANMSVGINEEKSGKKWDIILGVVIGGVVLLIGVGVVLWLTKRKRKVGKGDDEEFNKEHNAEKDSKSLRKLSPAADQFSVEELKRATQDFSEGSIIGKGNFGTVHRAELSDGSVVAVKRAKQSFGQDLQFQSEVAVLQSAQHEHLLPLLGFCAVGPERLLIFPFMSRGSLRNVLHNEGNLNVPLKQRIEIAQAVAEAIQDLHGQGIAHGDVKSSNVLLDDDWSVKVCDFGLARRFLPDTSHISTGIKGTVGYLDPEYVLTEHLTLKSDVYSFGVLMLELITGHSPPIFCLNNETLAEWVCSIVTEGRWDEVLDSRLLPLSEEGTKRAHEFVKLACSCTKKSSKERPDVTLVSEELGKLQL